MVKNGLKAIYVQIRAVINWLHKELQRSMNNFANDLQSMRIIWVWIILALYHFIVVWCVLYHADKCGNTAIMTTGGMVSWILTNYIISKQHDKKMAHEIVIAKLKSGHAPEKVPGEKGASD